MLLQRIGFFTLGVALPVSSMLSRRAAVVLVPIGVALLIIAALLTEPERFVRSFRRRCLRATTLALGLLIGWCLLSLGWAPKGGADRILNMLFALALGIAAIAALPERMRAANLNALAVGAGSAIAILIAMEMTGFGLGDRDDDLTLVIRGLALIITVSGPLVSWLLLRGRTRGGLALFGLLAAVTLVDAEPVLVVAMAAGTLAFAAVLAMRGRSVEWLALLLALIVMATPITPWIMLGAVQPVLHLDDQTLAPFSAWAALIAESLARGENYFLLWPELLRLPKAGFSDGAATVLEAATRDAARHDPQVLAALRAQPLATMADVADAFGRVITETLKTPDAPGLAAVINAPTSPLEFSRAAVAEDLLRFVTEHQIVARRDNEAAAKIREKLTILEASAPIDRAQVVTVIGAPIEPRVLIRGDRLKPGAAVPRRLPQVFAALDDRTFADDGRRALAEALASPRNPLTARVLVNRIWQQHFGRGLVATADDFGATGERPSHPELLDHLAAWFIAHGWSIKALQRYILTSATWQQSSAPQTDALARDAENRLLWRQRPRRLEFEAMRDSLLRVAGRLDTRLGGRGAALTDDNVRRAVYGYTDRFRIPSLLRSFDVANPDQSIARRGETTHPLQALFFLNSPFVRAQAEGVNRQPEIAELLDARARITATYRRILARLPDREETDLALGFVGAAPDEPRWTQFAQALLLSNEFLHCD